MKHVRLSPHFATKFLSTNCKEESSDAKGKQANRELRGALWVAGKHSTVYNRGRFLSRGQTYCGGCFPNTIPNMYFESFAIPDCILFAASRQQWGQFFNVSSSSSPGRYSRVREIYSSGKDYCVGHTKNQDQIRPSRRYIMPRYITQVTGSVKPNINIHYFLIRVLGNDNFQVNTLEYINSSFL